MTHTVRLLTMVCLPSLLLAACVPALVPATSTALATMEPTGLAFPTPTPQPTVRTQYYPRQTYTDEANGFKLDYPVGWTASPVTPIGPRGSQALLLSPGATASALPPGCSRLSITLYQWDPKGDLASYVIHQRAAWEASGFTTVVEKKGDLRDGSKEMDFVVTTPDGLQTFFLFTTHGEQYLEIAGEGDLGLIHDIAHTLRPLNFDP